MSEEDLTYWATVAFWLSICGLVAALAFGIREFQLWRIERREEASRVEAEAALEHAREMVEELAARNRAAEALAIIGPIEIVKTTRKGRSRSDKAIVAAEALLREVDDAR